MKIKRSLRRRAADSFTQVEAMVASAILMIAVSQSTALFTNSMQATGKAKLRDGLNAAVNADLEQVRHQVARWAIKSMEDGQLAYEPSDADCANATLAEAMVAATNLPSTETVDLSGVPMRQGEVQVNRTITVPTTNKNLIEINYATTSGSPVTINMSTTLTMPAQGWCP